MISGIYCIENKVNHKKYIGFAIDFNDRWRRHIQALDKNNHYNKYLQRSWNKYRKKNFLFYIVEECLEKDIKEKEKYYISFYNSYYKNRNGYNLTLGGDGLLGFHHSDKTKKKLSEINKGKESPMKGRRHSKKTRRKMSKSQTGNTNSKGRKRDFISKKNISEGHIGQIAWNKGIKNKNSSSKYFGVSINIKKGKYIYWNVNIYVNGKQKYIGQYKEEINAAKAYDKYVIENNLSSPLNFPITS